MRRLALFGLVWVSAAILPRAAAALVGPAREAPELSAYVVMVLNREDGSASFCSGSVIAPTIVLTAAHCVTTPRDTRIHFRDETGQATILEIDEVAIHPGYRPNAARRRQISIDLAMVRLAAPLPASFRPVTLSRARTVEIGQGFRIAGFGVAEEGAGKTGGVLRSGLVVANGPMSTILLWLRDPDDRGLGACTGDSGAPVFAPSQPVLVAVAVWARGEGGRNCGALTQAVLIEPQRAWIDTVLRSWGRDIGEK